MGSEGERKIESMCVCAGNVGETLNGVVDACRSIQ